MKDPYILLENSWLITAFVQFWPINQQKPHNEVGS